MFKSTFGDRLRMLRNEKELSQDEMAVDFVNKIGVIITKSSISYYENNKRRPDQKTLGILADYFDMMIVFALLAFIQHCSFVALSTRTRI